MGDLPVVGESSGGSSRGRWGSRVGGQNFLLAPSVINPGSAPGNVHSHLQMKCT